MCSIRVVWLCLIIVACCAPLRGQIVIAFQGAEPGNTWAFTASSASAIANSEAQSSLNYSSGTRSIVSGGLSGGGSCMNGGSGNGQSINNVISFADVDMSAYSNYNRQLSFHYGNRFPSCAGTGFDFGENLRFTAILDGVAQPAQVIYTGGNNATLSIQQTSYVYVIPSCVTTFAFEIQINLNRNDEFLFVDDVSLTTQGLITSPTLQCWETLSFNSTSGICELTGSQPPQPTLECWQTAAFNSTTCSWDITGTLPPQPISNNCWDNYQFDSALCAWVNDGTQPQQPAVVNCWDLFVFNTTTCQWESTGTQPLAPNNVACGLTAVFNQASCNWDLIADNPEPLPTNCWDDFVYNTTLCSWENIGVQPQAPNLACYETAVFSAISCSWVVTGSQPLQPNLQCYQTAVYNETACSWEVTGTPPQQPDLECGETATFNNAACNWDITGVPFAIDISVFSVSDFAPWSTAFSLLATGDVISVEWLIDGELVSGAESLDHTFIDAGEYDVFVSVVSSDGCAATDAITITLQPYISQLIIPNSFTPNFDGVNDLFVAEAEHLSSFQMLIYNRWGELLFQTNSLKPGWKGFSDIGYSYPDGTYVYVIDAVGKDGQVYHLTGGITLFR